MNKTILCALALLLVAASVHAAPKYNETRINVTGLENALLHVQNPNARLHLEQNLARWSASYGMNNYTNVTATDLNTTASLIEAEKPYKVLFFSVTGTDAYTMNSGQATSVKQSLLARILGKQLLLSEVST